MSIEQITHSSNVGVISVGDHYREDNVHLISNYWGLESFVKAPIPDHQLTVAFISTASRPYRERGEPHRFLDAERAWLEEKKRLGRIAYFEYCVADKTADQVCTALDSVDVIFIGGGNTQYLSEQLKKSGADTIIINSVKNGSWYLGKSAGAIVAGPDIHPRGLLLDSMACEPLVDTAGLGLVDVYPLPHIDTPSIMDKTYDGKTGWQHVVELARIAQTAYILDNNKERNK